MIERKFAEALTFLFIKGTVGRMLEEQSAIDNSLFSHLFSFLERHFEAVFFSSSSAYLF
jgi:hypothetical protein